MALSTATRVPLAAALARVWPAASHGLMQRWSASSLETLGVTLAVEDANEGRYDDGPYLFVSLNQTSLLEVFLYARFDVPVKIIVNLEFALIPVLGPSLVAMGSRVVVRQWSAQAKQALRGVAEAMRTHGDSFGMSVEGYRSPTGELQPFKRGAAVLGTMAQARIVPFYIRGAAEALPYGEWRVTPGRIEIELFDAIDTRGLGFDDRAAITDRLRVLAERAAAR